MADGDLVALEVVIVWAPLSLVPRRSHDPNVATAVLLQNLRVEVVDGAGLDTVSAWIWKMIRKAWVVRIMMMVILVWLELWVCKPSFGTRSSVAKDKRLILLLL